MACRSFREVSLPTSWLRLLKKISIFTDIQKNISVVIFTKGMEGSEMIDSPPENLIRLV